MKRCPKCGLTKPLSEWGKGTERGGVQSRCKECQRATTLAGYYARKAASPDGRAPLSEKVCTFCGIVKPAADFHRRRHGGSSGLTPRCRDCERDVRFAKLYGLSPEEVAAMTCCAICGSTERLHIDHCHDSGRVRGRLCYHCNLGLGYFRDNAEWLRGAALYLERDRHVAEAVTAI